MVQIVGKYLYESGENFDAFLKALDVGFILRNLAKTSKPTIEITLDGDTYTIKTITTLKTTEIKFKLGEEFEETRMDGKTVKVCVARVAAAFGSLTIHFNCLLSLDGHHSGGRLSGSDSEGRQRGEDCPRVYGHSLEDGKTVLFAQNMS